MFGKRLNVAWCLICLLLVWPAAAQDRGADDGRFAPDAEVREAFKPVVASARESVVSFYDDERVAALGTVVAADGLVLTKASEIEDVRRLEAVLPGGRRVGATIAGVDQANDLAFVRLAARGLVPVELVDEEPAVGRWVACAGPEASPESVGVVSAAAREIEPLRLVLGVILREHPEGVQVLAVSEGFGADRAGIKRGDVLTRVAGKQVLAVNQVIERLQRQDEGDAVPVRLVRGDEAMEVSVSLRELEPDPRSRSERMNRMGGAISDRRQGFERVLQHDAELRPEQCGGPLVNLRGEVVGLNIARAGRIATYALPAGLLNEKLAALERGAFTPQAEAKAGPDEAVADDAQPVNADRETSPEHQ